MVEKSSTKSPQLHDRVEAKIRRAAELKGHTRSLIYGRSGSGKTRLVASAPNVLLVDINEKGTASVRRDYNPNVYEVDLWTDLTDLYWYLASGNHTYKTVGLDGVTSMQNLCMKFVLGDEASRDASRDPDMPSRQVWGKVGELMKTQITNYRNLPMNVVFTALQRVRFSEGEEEDDATMITPACSPSIAGHLEAAVDIIGYLTTRRVKLKSKNEEKKTEYVTRRRLVLGSSERHLTKERYGVLGDYVDSPNLTTMFKQLNDMGV